jgi:ABC-type amino acid transport substrate-binding protein
MTPLPVKRAALRLLIAALAALTLAACRPAEDTAWERAEERGALRVGMDAAYPPFENVNEQNEIVGFDVDLAREIARRLDLDIEFVNIPYDSLYDSLVTGQVDMLVSALIAAYEYEAKADYSIPYFNAGQHLVVPAGAPIRGMEDLDGRTLAVEVGSGGDVEARKWERRLADLDVERYPDPGAALLAVLSDDADAALVDGISARLAAGEQPGLAVAAAVTDELFAVAVHPDSDDLLEHVNDALEDMFDDGTIDALLATWFEGGEPQARAFTASRQAAR